MECSWGCKLEHSFPVEFESFVPQGSDPAASPSDWIEQPYTPLFVAQVEDVLGEDSEPDPVFFVESWTVGVVAAAENLRQRRQQKARAQAAQPCQRFDSWLPFFSVEESALPQAGESRTLPLPVVAFADTYNTGWPPFRDAETPQTRPQSASPNEFENRRTGNQPLTHQSACHLLGVTAGSTREQIKVAYRHLAGRYHPDRMIGAGDQEREVATERMISINAAYRLLCATQLQKSA